MKSLIVLFKSPYNKKNPLMAIFRFLYWKIIKLFRLQNVKYSLWENKKIFLFYDSFQCMWLMYNYLVDFEEFNLIRDYVKPQDNVADVGANMGYYTIWMSKFVSEKGSINSFEPNPKNFLRLKNNCDLNGLKNISLNNTALSDIKGEILFTKSLDGENHISMLVSGDTVLVEVNTLDNYAFEKNIEHFSYIKVDIEGFELSFLLGAQRLLENKAIDIIQVEINEQIKNSATTKNDLLSKISTIGYKLCMYDAKKKMLIETTYQEERDNYFMVSNLYSVNQKLQSSTQ